MKQAAALELTFHWRRWKTRFLTSWHERIADRHWRTKVEPRQEREVLYRCFLELRTSARRSKAAKTALAEASTLHHFLQSLDAMEVLLGSSPSSLQLTAAMGVRSPLQELADTPAARPVVASPEARLVGVDDGVANAVLARLRGLASPIPPRPRGVHSSHIKATETLPALLSASPEHSPPPRSAFSLARSDADGTQPRDPRSATLAFSASPAPNGIVSSPRSRFADHEADHIHNYKSLLPQCSPAVQHFTLTLQKILSEYVPLAQQREAEQSELTRLLQMTRGTTDEISLPSRGHDESVQHSAGRRGVSFERFHSAQGNEGVDVEERIHWLRDRQQRRITLWDQLQLLLSEPDREAIQPQKFGAV
jgi:hypothetical protein